MKKCLRTRFLIQVVLAFLVALLLPSSVLAATLSLSPASGTFNKGCTVTLAVVLDTEGAQTDGTDVILFYDPTRFSAQNITNGTIYPDFPGNYVDTQAGKIVISGLASVSAPFAGTGTLATINLAVTDNAPSGATQIRFDFDPNEKDKTTDSNVVERGTVADVLNSVVNGNFVIGSGSCLASASPSPVASPGTAVPPGSGLPPGTTQPPGSTIYPGRGTPGISTYSAQPKTLDQYVDKTGKGPGTPQLTFTLAIVGSALTILGILGLALL